MSSSVKPIMAAALSLLLAGCGGGGSSRISCPEGQRCLEVGSAAEPFTLDPNKAQMVQESHILYDTLIGLTTLNAKGETIPGMATSWSTSPDGLVWTFKLRKAVWSDGVPVTANDFVTSFRRIQDPKTASPYAYLLYVIAGSEAVNAGKAKPETIGVSAPDPQTLVIRLVHPVSYLPLLMVHSVGMPVPTHSIQKWGDKWIEPGNYVSNGPYTLASWKLGDRVVLTRNPKFHEAKEVCFDRVSYFPVTDAVSGERRVESGELDMLEQFNSNRADYLRKRLPGYVHTNPILAVYYISLNSDVPQLKDKRVRQALSMSVDRDFLATKLMRAGQKPVYGFTPPGLPGYTQMAEPAWTELTFDQRLVEARRLMKEAGYGPDRPLRLELKYSSSSDKVIPAALQADWRSIGAEFSLAPTEGQIHFSELNAKAFQVAVDGWIADFPDPNTFLSLLASTSGPQNHAGYNNPAYDKLLATADLERDGVKRMAILREAETLAMADYPNIPLYTGSSRTLLNPRISGFQSNPVDFHPKRYMCTAEPTRATGS